MNDIEEAESKIIECGKSFFKANCGKSFFKATDQSLRMRTQNLDVFTVEDTENYAFKALGDTEVQVRASLHVDVEGKET